MAWVFSAANLTCHRRPQARIAEEFGHLVLSDDNTDQAQVAQTDEMRRLTFWLHGGHLLAEVHCQEISFFLIIYCPVTICCFEGRDPLLGCGTMPILY
ncbi:hypothetical protein E2C01_094786 [Portunus trituberculatus]|uniref:Uncharacterized protein n=1 Tax=Portunus trituberculatus TaxID=210409 RepID=A0A5B7JYK4_PORTR|nr:hypothetical protein [Portunus trituberculatus]